MNKIGASGALFILLPLLLGLASSVLFVIWLVRGGALLSQLRSRRISQSKAVPAISPGPNHNTRTQRKTDIANSNALLAEKASSRIKVSQIEKLEPDST